MNHFALSRRRFLQSTTLAVAGAPFIARGADRVGFEIELVADAQYADLEAKGTRHYRRSLTKLAAAVEHGNSRDLAFGVHLGDLIDREWRSFDDIMQPLAASRHRWYQLLGNHDFDVLDQQKPAVPGRLGLASRRGTFTHGDWRFVLLDTNAVSLYAHPAGSAARKGAEDELARLQAGRVRQAKSWNGGVGAEQLAWFERECDAARAARQRVIVFAHHPVFPDNDHNAWDAAAVLAAIDRHPHVVAWFNGHNHAGAYGVRQGVPYVTLKGMVETAETTAFATARFLADRILLTGHGREPSRELLLRAV
jgi:manganese-dependent ADP-ribose/CDP-alcohol diphosphatase